MAAPPMRAQADPLLVLFAIALGGAALFAAADKHFGELRPIEHYLGLALLGWCTGFLVHLFGRHFPGADE